MTGEIVLFSGSATSADLGGGLLSNANATNVFLAKFDPAGTLLWSKHIANQYTQQAVGVAINGSGDILIAADVQGTAVEFGNGPLFGVSLTDNDIGILRLAP